MIVNSMPHRINNGIELFIALITLFTSFMMSDFFIQLITATLTYTLARLFYYYFGEKIKRIIDNLNNKFKRLK